MPTGELPDPQTEKLCIRCGKWYQDDEGTLVYPQGRGLFGAMRRLASVVADDVSARRFMCFRCIRIRRHTRIVLVAAGVIVLLLLFGLPLLKPPRDGKGHPRTKCLNNLKMIGVALHMYADDNERWLPRDLYALIETGHLMNDTSCFDCRSRKGDFPSRFTSREDFVSDYWYRGSGRLPRRGAAPNDYLA